MGKTDSMFISSVGVQERKARHLMQAKGKELIAKSETEIKKETCFKTSRTFSLLLARVRESYIVLATF